MIRAEMQRTIRHDGRQRDITRAIENRHEAVLAVQLQLLVDAPRECPARRA